MTLAALRELPTTIVTGPTRVHESIFRSYQTLQWVRQQLMLQEPVPPKLLLEIIDDVLDSPHVTKEIN